MACKYYKTWNTDDLKVVKEQSQQPINTQELIQLTNQITTTKATNTAEKPVFQDFLHFNGFFTAYMFIYCT
jgi:hypothetical protein